MFGIIITLSIPLIIAFLMYQETRLDSAWAFFCSSLIAFYLTINMRPYTTAWMESLLPEKSPFLYPCVYFGYGLIMLIILYLLLSLIVKKVNAKFPQKIAGVMQFFLIYAGIVTQVVLLVLSTFALVQVSQEKPTGFLGMVNQRIAPVRAFYGQQVLKLQWLGTLPGKNSVLREK